MNEGKSLDVNGIINFAGCESRILNTIGIM